MTPTLHTCKRQPLRSLEDKLDVRAAAAKLPDEADDPAALDDSEVLAEGAEDNVDGDLDAAPAETSDAS